MKLSYPDSCKNVGAHFKLSQDGTNQRLCLSPVVCSQRVVSTAILLTLIIN